MKFFVNHGEVKDGKFGKFLKLLLRNPELVCEDGERPDAIEFLLNLGDDKELIKKAQARCEKIKNMKGTDEVMTLEVTEPEFTERKWKREVTIRVESEFPAKFGEEERVQRRSGGIANL